MLRKKEIEKAADRVPQRRVHPRGHTECKGDQDPGRSQKVVTVQPCGEYSESYLLFSKVKCNCPTGCNCPTSQSSAEGYSNCT